MSCAVQQSTVSVRAVFVWILFTRSAVRSPHVLTYFTENTTAQSIPRGAQGLLHYPYPLIVYACEVLRVASGMYTAGKARSSQTLAPVRLFTTRNRRPHMETFSGGDGEVRRQPATCLGLLLITMPK